MSFARLVSRSSLLLTLLTACGDEGVASQPGGTSGDAGASAGAGHAGIGGRNASGSGGRAGAGGGAGKGETGGRAGTSGSAGSSTAGASAVGGSAGSGGTAGVDAGMGGAAGSNASAAGNTSGGASGSPPAGASGSGGGGAGGSAAGGASGSVTGGAGGAITGGAGGSASGGESGSNVGGAAGSNAAGSAGAAAAGAGGGSVHPNDTCPGVALSIPVGESHVSGTTVGATHGASPDDCEGPDTAPDVVYAITPEATGSLIFDVSDTFGTKAYLRTACDDAQTQIACAWISGVAQVEKGKTYFLFVDGFGQASGAFSIAFTLEETCGNALYDEGEECDDGNTTPDDGCDATCHFEPPCRSQETEVNGFATPNAIGPSSCRTLLVEGTLGDTDTDWFAVQVPAAHAVEAYPFGPVGECAPGRYLIAMRDQPPASNGTTTCPNDPTCERHDQASDPCLASLPFPTAGTAYIRLRNLTASSTPYTLSVTLFPF